MAVLVEREHEYNGWRIREDTQRPGTGMIVTDKWLLDHGFGTPRRSNIDQIVQATIAAAFGGFKLRMPSERDVDPEGLMTQTKFYRTGQAKAHDSEPKPGAVRSMRKT